MLRLSLAVIVGFVLWSALWLGGNTLLQARFPAAMRADGSVDDVRLLGLLLLFALVVSVVAGYTTQVIAQAVVLRAALILGVLLLLVGIAVQSQYWSLLPVWYHIIFLVILCPATVLGGWLRLR